jgi:hypothetical protein
MLLFFIGLALMGLLTGFLSGISATPVVSIMLPLLFALVTAGGGFYVVWGKRDGDEAVTKRDRVTRARFLGMQMVGFVPCFLAGVWLGVYAKFNPDCVWPRSSNTLVYPQWSFSDPSLLQYFRTLDVTLLNDGVSVSDRSRILHVLHDQRDKWQAQASELVHPLKPQQPNEFKEVTELPFLRLQQPSPPVAQPPANQP